jgi:hypothetical protein
MAATTAGYSRRRRTGLAPRFVVFATALAFLLQCLVTQIHIHSEPADGAVKLSTALSAAQGKAPLDHSQRDCPFCQATVHAGAFLMPATMALLLTQASVFIADFVAPRPTGAATAHSWQSRAPPSR